MKNTQQKNYSRKGLNCYWTGIWGGFVDAQKLSYLTTDPVQDNSFPISSIYKHWAYSSYAETWKPKAAYNPVAKKFMVAWRETPGTEPENDTKVNHIRANRAFVQIPPPANVVLSATSGNEDPNNPAIAASTYSSNALVVWEDHRNSATTNWDLYGSLYTILPAVSITVLAPNGGELWPVNTQQEIKWTSTNFSDPVTISVSYDGYNPQVWQILAQSTPNDGSFIWTVPNNTSGNCVIGVADAADGDPYDVSDAPFSIVVPYGTETITVVSPNGNENWPFGSQQEIKWTSANLTNPVRIEYSTTGGASYTTIVASTANDGSYLWTIPNTPSSLCAVKILDATDNDPWDISDAVFSISPVAYPWMIVNNTQDYDPGSLRQAILDANAHPGNDTIRFAIPTYDPGFNAGMGVWTIKPQSPLPSISDGGTVMDATTQTMWVGDTNPRGPEIEIDGSQAGATAHGIVLASPNNAIYGLVINRFAGSGIVIAGAQSDSNVISMNYIGVNPTATAVAPNGGAGIWIEGAPANFIPILAAPLYANVIGGNQAAGIAILGSGAQGNIILCNYIGTDSTQSHNLGNQGDGILIAAGAANTIITGEGYPVVIKHNGGAGIRISGSGTVTNAIWGGAISGNAGPGILLEDGGNNNMPAPIINEADSVHVAGTGPPDTWIQIYADEADEGAVFLGLSPCDATGTFYWSGPVVGPNVTATATLLSGPMYGGNTSMFSAPFPFAGVAYVRTVINTNDSGPGSLREALAAAGSHPGPDTVIFNIPTTDPGYNLATGVWTIKPATGYDVPSGTVVDGTVTTALAGEGNTSRPGIEIDGTTLGQLGVTGLWLYDGVTLRGLVVNHFQYGIWVASANATIEGCYVGTDPTGTSAKPNGTDGILIARGATSAVI